MILNFLLNCEGRNEINIRGHFYHQQQQQRPGHNNSPKWAEMDAEFHYLSKKKYFSLSGSTS
jgi:hypothetical protein